MLFSFGWRWEKGTLATRAEADRIFLDRVVLLGFGYGFAGWSFVPYLVLDMVCMCSIYSCIVDIICLPFGVLSGACYVYDYALWYVTPIYSLYSGRSGE